MKAKVLNNKNYNSNENFKVLSMNYDFVMIKLNDDKKILKSSEVELLSENKGEDIFIYYKDILKIKLDNGIPMNFYASFISFIEEIIQSKIKKIDVLEDNFSFIKKGIWEKKLVVIINESKIFKISAIGEKFCEDFRFTIKQINLVEFIDYSNFQIKELQKQIEEKQELKNRYERSLEGVISSSISQKETILLNI